MYQKKIDAIEVTTEPPNNKETVVYRFILNVHSFTSSNIGNSSVNCIDPQLLSNLGRVQHKQEQQIL